MKGLELLVISLLTLTLVGCYTTLATLSAKFPANTFTLGILPASTTIALDLTWTLALTAGNSMTVSLTKVGKPATAIIIQPLFPQPPSALWFPKQAPTVFR